jgi:hypothetical protein
MKTTLMIDDSVLKMAKQAAASRETTVSDLVNQSLRAFLTQRPKPASDQGPFVLPVFGQPGPAGVDRSPAALATLRDEGR